MPHTLIAKGCTPAHHPNNCKSTTGGMAAEKYRRHGRQATTSGMAAKQQEAAWAPANNCQATTSDTFD
jgi:hypothetical protein